MRFIIWLIIGGCCWGFPPGDLAVAEEPASPLPAGQAVPSFYSRVVTGPLKNQSVCFVCRNGNRPTIMVITRKLTPELKLFLRNVDRIVDDHRVSGLKCFGVYLTDEGTPAVSAVQTFAFDGKLKTPLTVGNGSLTTASCLNLDADAETAIVLYREKSVVASHSYRAGEFTKAKMQPLLKEVLNLVESAPETAPDDNTEPPGAD
jgi:hypothetical protein